MKLVLALAAVVALLAGCDSPDTDTRLRTAETTSPASPERLAGPMCRE
jgi:hypothetical protein